MAELCLMASQRYPPGLLFHPAECFPGRFYKDSSYFLSNYDFNQDAQRLSSFVLRMHPMEVPLKPVNGMFEDSYFSGAHSNMRRPLLIDIEDFPPRLIHEKALQFVFSRSSGVERGAIDLSKVLDPMGPQAAALHMPQQPIPPYYQQQVLEAEFCPLISPIMGLVTERPRTLFVGHLGHSHLSEDQLPVTYSWTEIEAVLGNHAEIYLSNNTTNWKKQAMVVPYFNRRVNKGAKKNNSQESSQKVEPLKSSTKVKDRNLAKRKGNIKASKERDFYKNNSLHACEKLLSLIVDKKRHGKTAINSLKKSGPEIPKLLTQFSASIAGTGLAVVFSVVCKVACSNVPFCASKLFSTGMGLGLVWLSWAVNNLRDTVISISKNSGKLGGSEEEMMSDLDGNLRDIYLRAITLMVVAVLRFA